MDPKLRKLLIALGSVAAVSAAGVYLGQRDIFAPKPGVSDAELADAGVLNCPVRNVRWRVVSPQGRVFAQEGKVRMCPGQEGVLSREMRNKAAQGWTVIWVRDLGAAAGGESDPVDAVDECACRVTAQCTAQPVDNSGNIGARAALPVNMVAGPTYAWRNPQGTDGGIGGIGCTPMPCTETQAGLEWPAACPRQ